MDITIKDPGKKPPRPSVLTTKRKAPSTPGTAENREPEANTASADIGGTNAVSRETKVMDNENPDAGKLDILRSKPDPNKFASNEFRRSVSEDDSGKSNKLFVREDSLKEPYKLSVKDTSSEDSVSSKTVRFANELNESKKNVLYEGDRTVSLDRKSKKPPPRPKSRPVSIAVGSNVEDIIQSRPGDLSRNTNESDNRGLPSRPEPPSLPARRSLVPRSTPPQRPAAPKASSDVNISTGADETASATAAELEDDNTTTQSEPTYEEIKQSSVRNSNIELQDNASKPELPPRPDRPQPPSRPARPTDQRLSMNIENNTSGSLESKARGTDTSETMQTSEHSEKENYESSVHDFPAVNSPVLPPRPPSLFISSADQSEKPTLPPRPDVTPVTESPSLPPRFDSAIYATVNKKKPPPLPPRTEFSSL